MNVLKNKLKEMNTQEQKLRSNIWKFYLQKILQGMYFSVPIMVLFWQDNGLNLTEVMILQSAFAILTVILEIPTGYFADVYGRKKTLMIAAVSSTLAITAYSFGCNFWHFLIAELIFGFSVSFSSGTQSAILFDTLQELGEEKKYKKIWGNALFYSMMALAVSNTIGGFIAKVDLRYALYASIPFFASVILVVASMKEPKRHKLIFKKGYTRELLKIIKVALTENKKLRWIIIYSGVIYSFNQSALWLYQPYFQVTGLDVAYFGIVFASFQLVAAFSSKYSHKLEEKLGQKYSLSMLIFLVAGSYLLMANFVFLFSFSFCFIQQLVRGFKNTVINDYINHLTTSNMRATVLSLESFVGRLMYALIVPIFGWIADVYTVVQALSVIGITALISGIIIMIIFKKDKIL